MSQKRSYDWNSPKETTPKIIQHFRINIVIGQNINPNYNIKLANYRNQQKGIIETTKDLNGLFYYVKVEGKKFVLHIK